MVCFNLSVRPRLPPGSAHISPYERRSSKNSSISLNVNSYPQFFIVSHSISRFSSDMVPALSTPADGVTMETECNSVSSTIVAFPCKVMDSE